MSDDSFYDSWSKDFDYLNWFISKLIGAGAYANVYLVKHIEIQDEVASLKPYAMKTI